MIKKDKLLGNIGKLMELESHLVPLLENHISSAISFSKLDNSEKEEIQKQLERMANAERRNIEMLKELNKEITENSKEIY